ncbi:MAG: M67 family metallopeptidase [Saprospiraceae bacterium]|nr:M67 family metallopeptidase [Saprospiraceae bacterium]
MIAAKEIVLTYKENHKKDRYIIVPIIIRRQIERLLEGNYPNEGVGFFYGDEKDNYRIIKRILPVKNVKEGDQRKRFEIDPRDYLQAEKFAEEWSLSLLGIYHSHPNHPAIPSVHDLKRAVPYFSYIILSIENSITQDWTSWRLDEKVKLFEQENLVI